MTDFEGRIRRLERRLPGAPQKLSDATLAAQLDAKLHGYVIDAEGQRQPNPNGGWLDAYGELRDDLSPVERQRAEEVLRILGRASARARGDDLDHSSSDFH